MSADPVLVEHRSGYQLITLNRPERLNAFNAAQHTALAAALSAAEADPDCRAVLLTGAGRGFCAGQDLADRDPAAGAPDLGHTLDTLYNPLVAKLRALPMPVICAVNGVAAGAGANIALACDIVLAARSARFIQAFAAIGLIPDSGGTWWLTRFLGEPRAKALAIMAEPIGADAAAAWGLIWRAVDDDALLDEAAALAAKLAAGPTQAYSRIKQAIHAAEQNTLPAQLDLERDLQREAGLTEDYREGVSAFLEKRPPRFSGR